MTMPKFQSTTDELLAAIDLVTAALLASGRNPYPQIGALRREITERAETDLAIGEAYDKLWHAHLDANGISYDEYSEPMPPLARRLIRAAVEATGATITPAEKIAAPTEGGAR